MMLEVKALSYRSILYDLTFSVAPGELVAILGPNGAGKTTLFRCLAQLIKPDQGEILLQGRPIEVYSPKELYQILTLAPQFSQIGFPYTVLTVALMGRASYLSPFSRPRKHDYEKAQEALALLGIQDLASRPFNTLSGGQRRLVLIARALAQEAKLLLLDEPTAHLDLKHQILVLSKIRELSRQKGLTILVSLHDPNLALTYADRVLCLKKGKLVGELTDQDRKWVQQTLEDLYGLSFSVFETPEGLLVFPCQKDKSRVFV